VLEIKQLVKRYPKGELALDGVDLSVDHGQIVALIGPSGAGKSTLIRCVNRLVEPTSGTIIFGGVDVGRLSPRALRRMRREMGMVFQEYAVVDRTTVMENVLTGQLGYVSLWPSLFRRFPSATVERAFELLERTGLLEYADNRADELSGGQRQRVGIARALLQSPRILLVDEPTASLDPKTSRQIMRLIIELVQERELAAIINIHDVELARRFTQRIVGLQKGRVVFDGAPGELDQAALTRIYGEDDWSAPRHDDDDGDDEGETAYREGVHVA
jgi:phosphonate transport system ATP-binding protein